MNKRGISSVVGITLMTLGAIIGVAVLWAFINKNIDNANNQVVDPDCLTIDLEVVNCRAYGMCSFYSGGGGYEANVLISRKVGRGNITALRFIFEDPFGIQRTLDRDLNTVGLSELQSIQFTEPYEALPILGKPYLISVAGLLGPDKNVCPIKTRSKTCPINNQPPPSGFIANTTYTGAPQTYSHTNRGGYCCQFPANFSECYNGQDPNFPINPVTNLPANLPPNAYPYNNITMCCGADPGTGQTIFGGGTQSDV